MINRNHVVGYGCWLLLALLPACSSKDSDHPDVQFAKATFLSMVNGTADETAIDWETFRAHTHDVGAIYKALPNEAEKADLRKSFLLGFSVGTPNLRARPDSIIHWRVKTENSSETIVAADLPKHERPNLAITVSKRSGTQKVSSLQFNK